MPSAASGENGAADERQDPAEGLGARLAAHRERAGLSVSALAREIGVSPSLISQIERGQSRPSVSTLFGLAETLEVPVDAFLRNPSGRGEAAEGQPAERAAADDVRIAREHVVRAGERATIDIEGGVRWERLTPETLDELQFTELIYEPGAESNPSPYRHPGTELVLVTEGELEIAVGGEPHALAAGDSICFASTTPHRYVNRGEATARALSAVLSDVVATPLPHDEQAASAGREGPAADPADAGNGTLVPAASDDGVVGDADHATAGIGGRLAAHRERAGLSVSALARRIGVSPSLISQIERGQSRPSVSTLFSLAETLEVPVDAFLRDAPRESEPVSAAPRGDFHRWLQVGGEIWPDRSAAAGDLVVRAGARPAMVVEGGLTLARLTARAVEEFEFMEVTYAPAVDVKPRLYRHPGAEVLVVVEGELEIAVGFELFHLREGDSIYFGSTTPHRYINATDRPTRAVTVMLRDPGSAQSPASS